MNQPKKKPAALTARGAVSSPYTVPGERPREVVNSTEAAELRALDRKLTDGLNLVHGQFAVLREEWREDRKELRAEIARVDERAAQRTTDLETTLRAEIAKVDEHAAKRDERAAQRTTDLETTLRAEIAKVDERAAKRDERAAQRTTDLETTLRTEIAKVDEHAAKRDERAAQRTTDLETTLRAQIAKVDEHAAKRDERAAQRTTDVETAIRELTSKVSTSLERGSGTRRLALMFVGGFVLLVTGAVIRPVLERAVSSLLGG